MQGRLLFEYAVIRYVPRVEREEFVNVGIILYCKEEFFLKSMFTIDEHKLFSLFGKTDFEELQEHLAGFNCICTAQSNSGVIGKLTISERFRWLTATKSTILQTSKVHTGFCTNAHSTLLKLFENMVL